MICSKANTDDMLAVTMTTMAEVYAIALTAHSRRGLASIWSTKGNISVFGEKSTIQCQIYGSFGSAPRDLLVHQDGISSSLEKDRPPTPMKCPNRCNKRNFGLPGCPGRSSPAVWSKPKTAAFPCVLPSNLSTARVSGALRIKQNNMIRK